ncbi:MAG: hypothetical protein DMG40_15705 [Acidobacteria bacterium]|nr:MAG: hypothetical protein DMG40_15705 [Acidobacteriota bacterium]
MTMPITKQAPLLEDLRNHSQEQVAELRQLLTIGAPSRPDPRRPGFYEVEGCSHTYYVFKYPSGVKVLLLAVWERDPIAEMVACSCPAA